MSEYNKSFVEVNEVLNYLPDEYYNKIPEEIIDIIEENKDTNYTWEYDETKELKNQDISKEAIAILSYINLNYLLNEKQKAYMEQILKNTDIEEENKNSEKYNVDNLFKNNSIQVSSEENVQDVLNKNNETIKDSIAIKKEKTFFERIINKIISFFKK